MGTHRRVLQIELGQVEAVLQRQVAEEQVVLVLAVVVVVVERFVGRRLERRRRFGRQRRLERRVRFDAVQRRNLSHPCRKKINTISLNLFNFQIKLRPCT